MFDPPWGKPATEDEYALTLRQVEEHRLAGDLKEYGYGLLTLARMELQLLFKVPEATLANSRQHTLQAVDAFRQAGHMPGLIQALVATEVYEKYENSPKKNVLVQEAATLAAELEDEFLIAVTAEAMARQMFREDGAEKCDLNRARELLQKALAIFRKLGHQEGQANCLHGLILCETDVALCRDYSYEAAQLERTGGEFKCAWFSLCSAFMFASVVQPLTELEYLAYEQMELAELSGNIRKVRMAHQTFALIEFAKGNRKRAEEHVWQWCAHEYERKLTRYERWQLDVEKFETLLNLAKTARNRTAKLIYKKELARLEAEKPAKLC